MTKEYAKYIAGLILFGSNGIIAAQVGLPSYDIVILRTLLGTLLLAAIFFSRKRIIASLANKKDAFFVIVSGTAMGVSWILLYEAYVQIGVGLSSLLYYCGPILVVAVSPFVFKERLDAGRIASVVIVLIGMVLLNGIALSQGASVFGLCLGIGSAICLAILVIFNKKGESITGLENSLLQLGTSFVVATVITALMHGLSMDFASINWPAILFLGLVNTGIGCYLYFSSLPNLSAQSVSVLGYLEPLSAVILAALILGETMNVAQIIGAALVIGGALVGEVLENHHRNKQHRQ